MGKFQNSQVCRKGNITLLTKIVWHFHSFWAIKFLLVIGGIIGAFFIPEGSFGPTWMYFGMIGGFCFIIIQLILIVDFAHSWAEAWVGNYEETESKGWSVYTNMLRRGIEFFFSRNNDFFL